MKIKEITLFTSKITKQLSFFRDQLGCEIIEQTASGFSIRTGATKLTFELSHVDYKYHYCFLIPSNKLKDSLDWLQERIDLVEIEKGRFIQAFESWNAESVYFYDGAGNLAEFIVRYDLKNDVAVEGFGLNQIISFNEIGMPTNNVGLANNQLETELKSTFWKGDLERFGTNGTQDGLFLLVNNDLKKTWFPTDLPTQSCPFRGVFESIGKEFQVEFSNQIIVIR